LTLIGGFASTLSWPLIFALLKHMDWRGVFFVFAGFQLLVSAPIYFLLIARMTKPRPPGEAPLPGPTPMIQGSLARSPYFWAVALCFAINTYITTALTLHLVPALSSVAEIGEAQAVLIGMAFGPAQVAARVAELLFLRRHSAFALALFSFGLMPFALAAIALATMSPDVAFVATAVAGASNGLMTIARGILPLALFGRENFGANLGLFVLPGRIAMAAAPVTFAWLLAAVNVPAAFTYLLGGAIISFVAMIALSRFR
jgi:predicted MFS family arabinose efflux permease